MDAGLRCKNYKTRKQELSAVAKNIKSFGHTIVDLCYSVGENTNDNIAQSASRSTACIK